MSQGWRFLGNLGARSACIAVGVLLTSGLVQGMKEPVRWLADQKPKPVRVSVRAAAPAAAQAPAIVPTPAPPVVSASKADPKPVRKPVPPKEGAARKVLPLQGEAVTPKPSLPPEVTAESPSMVVMNQPLMTLSQPAMLQRPEPTTPTLPAIPGMEAPPMPSPDESVSPMPGAYPTPLPETPDQYQYPEERFGSVLVLELKINDQGQVIDSRILVPSFNGLGDIALVMAVKGQTYKNLVPPLYPGEVRRLELRIPYAATQPEIEDGSVQLP